MGSEGVVFLEQFAPSLPAEVWPSHIQCEEVHRAGWGARICLHVVRHINEAGRRRVRASDRVIVWSARGRGGGRGLGGTSLESKISWEDRSHSGTEKGCTFASCRSLVGASSTRDGLEWSWCWL